MEVELREAAGDFSADVKFDLAGPPVPDTNFALLWLANVCHLGESANLLVNGNRNNVLHQEI